MNVKRLLGFFAIALVAAVVTGYTGLYLAQDYIVFQSIALEKDYVFQFDKPFEENFIPVPNKDGTKDTLDALLFHSDTSKRGTILYFHGNRGNLVRWGRYAADLTRYGYDVLVIDYRGYGKSTGRPTEADVYADAEEVYRWALEHLDSPNIIIFGRSLGSAVASHLAAIVQPKLLILETPFDELRGVAQPYLLPFASLLPLKYTFSNSEHLRSVRGRVVIFHGTNDRIVPLGSALRLKGFTEEGDFVILEGGTHRNLGTYPEYQQKLKAVLAPF